MANLTITVRGAKELAAALSDPDLIDRVLRPGFRDAAVIVEGAARANVHRVTGKLQGALGHTIDGHGRNLEARIGPQPGRGQPAKYDTSSTSAWKRPRPGTNKGDPREYATYEEGGTRYRPGHPFLEPALTENIDRIENAMQDAANAVLNSLRRRR